MPQPAFHNVHINTMPILLPHACFIDSFYVYSHTYRCELREVILHSIRYPLHSNSFYCVAWKWKRLKFIGNSTAPPNSISGMFVSLYKNIEIKNIITCLAGIPIVISANTILITLLQRPSSFIPENTRSVLQPNDGKKIKKKNVFLSN